MTLPMFTLLQGPKSLAIHGDLESDKPHEKVPEARDRTCRIPEGRVITTLWRERLHCVVYQCPLGSEIAIRARNALLFDRYGEGLGWNEILDNGFGKSYWRSDQKVFALWNYATDFNTFATQDFHKVGWGPAR